ncbi:unnamed protein product [Cuscuta epithymum]|uniref:Uncharacterized protein n=1 Tax=Cuscuta epithymum TaxID=186058 RepID=A0AAV0FJ48_9ASTE|nr:unnamed protein product [Cuscuta epithymum]
MKRGSRPGDRKPPVPVSN